eukprot:COSAG02_NODE_28009_length_598_cov_0.859719_1_plen_25_part_10
MLAWARVHGRAVVRYNVHAHGEKIL